MANELPVLLTKEERMAGITQLGCRIDELQKQATESTNFKRISELVEFIKPIVSLRNKLMKA